MRFVWIGLIVLFASCGALFGALNGESVSYDFYYGVVDLPKGAALLSALLGGWIMGGLLVWFGVVMPLRSKLARAQRKVKRHDISAKVLSSPTPADI